MELRVLRYFLAVAKEENITEASRRLHITQPTLSRQMMDLEGELGVKLFHRGRHSRKIILTEAGLFLRRRAEELVALADKTEAAFSPSGANVSGEVHVAAAETDTVRLLARAARSLQEEHFYFRYYISSGDSIHTEEQLDKGLADFGLFLGPVNQEKYDYLTMPVKEVWGILMRKDTPLAAKSSVCAKDLWDKPLLLPRQAGSKSMVFQWLKKEESELNVVNYFMLVYNAALMAEEGLGYVMTLDKLTNVSGDSSLCFRPLEPRLEIETHLAWRKYQVFSNAAEVFLARMRQLIENSNV